MWKEKPKPTTLVTLSEEIVNVKEGDETTKKIHRIIKFKKPKDSIMFETNDIKPEDIIEETEEIVGEEISQQLPQKRSEPKKTIIKRRMKKPEDTGEIIEHTEIEENVRKQKKIIVRKYRQRPGENKPKLIQEEKILMEKIIEVPTVGEPGKCKKILLRRKLKPNIVDTEFILEKNVMEEIDEVTSEEVIELPSNEPEEPKKWIIRSKVKKDDGTEEMMERPVDKSMIEVDVRTKRKFIRRPVITFD
ncbi:hypothetical protein BLA29_008037, partial [Euroglyphus maynei]